jgi:hypothetical protein
MACSKATRSIADAHRLSFGSKLRQKLVENVGLDINYHKPSVSSVIDLYAGLNYKMAWDYFGCNETGATSPFGLATIPLQDSTAATRLFYYGIQFRPAVCTARYDLAFETKWEEVRNEIFHAGKQSEVDSCDDCDRVRF